MTDSEALCASLGITYRQLDHWCKRRYLRPVVKVNPNGLSHGQKRQWPESELMVAREMGRLVRVGLRPDAAARAARALVDCGWER